jgi:hypothetical protein
MITVTGAGATDLSAVPRSRAPIIGWALVGVTEQVRPRPSRTVRGVVGSGAVPHVASRPARGRCGGEAVGLPAGPVLRP